MRYPRYPAYKDSGVDWIGKVPREWKIKKLKSLTRIQTGITPPTDKSYYYSEEPGFPWIKPDDIEESLYPSKASKYLSNEGSKIVKKIDAGSTIVCCIGTIGKLGYVDSVASTNQQINSVKSLSGNDKFIYFALAACKKEMESLASGNVIQILNKKKLGDIFVPLPSDLEMTNIADYLKTQVSKINKLADKIKNFIDVLNEKRQTIITKAVTKGLDPNVPMKDSGVEWIGEIPEHWKAIKLKSGSIFNPPKSEIKGYSGETLVSFFPMESIGDDGKLEHLYFRPISEVINGYTYFKNGDVVIAKITPCFENGKGALIEGMKSELGFGTTELIVIRPLPILTKSFLYFLTITGLFRNLGEGAMHGASGQKRVPEKFVTNFKFGLPPLGEQIQISNYVKVNIHKIDDLISKQQKMIEFLNEYKTSLITHAVTGKIDVRGFAVPTDSKSA